MATAAERRAAEAARIKAQSEERKQRVAEKRTAPDANELATMRYQAMQQAVEAGKQVSPSPATPQNLPRKPQGVAGADWVLENGQYVLKPRPPAKPKPVAGADWVLENGQWNLVPNTGGQFARTPEGGLTPKPAESDDVVFKIAMQKLSQYGLTGIADSLKKARDAYPELEINDLLFLVENDDRYNKPFKDRFKANELRFTKGLPKLSAADYLTMEEGYKKIFSTYNLPMFANQNQYDKLIAGDVDVDDVTNRVVMAYDRVMTDTSTRNAFRQFYGSLTDADIASALLDPTQQIPALEKKVMAAEVGGQALRQGLAASTKELQAMVTPDGKQVTGYTNVQRGTLGAEALVAEGVTEASAARDYERVAEQLPTAEKLSSIYAGRTEQVGQRELEQAELLGLESAKRKQRKLAGMEEATFAGEAGTMRTSLGRRGRQGAF
jgi:hypothetical protein